MKEFTFDGQRVDESVEEVVRNHPYILLVPGIKSVIALAIPVAVLIFMGATTLFTITFFLALLILFAIFGKAYYEFAASVLIVTNQRIVYLDQQGFLKRKIIETNLDKVQSVTSDTSGMMKTTLDYGDLIIHTAGTNAGSGIVIKNIPQPYQVQQSISKRLL